MSATFERPKAIWTQRTGVGEPPHNVEVAADWCWLWGLLRLLHPQPFQEEKRIKKIYTSFPVWPAIRSTILSTIENYLWRKNRHIFLSLLNEWDTAINHRATDIILLRTRIQISFASAGINSTSNHHAEKFITVDLINSLSCRTICKQ